jgi:hypothetical protein
MSAVMERTTQNGKRLTPAMRGALIAALTAGMSQVEVAEQFKVHRNTVSRMFNQVKRINHPANPLSVEWKNGALPVAQGAVMRGMSHEGDPIGAANVALKLMHGIGYLTTSNQLQVDGNVNLQVSWGAVQEPDPEPALDVDHKQISE